MVALQQAEVDLEPVDLSTFGELDQQILLASMFTGSLVGMAPIIGKTADALYKHVQRHPQLKRAIAEAKAMQIEAKADFIRRYQAEKVVPLAMLRRLEAVSTPLRELTSDVDKRILSDQTNKILAGAGIDKQSPGIIIASYTEIKQIADDRKVIDATPRD